MEPWPPGSLVQAPPRAWPAGQRCLSGREWGPVRSPVPRPAQDTGRSRGDSLLLPPVSGVSWGLPVDLAASWARAGPFPTPGAGPGPPRQSGFTATGAPAALEGGGNAFITARHLFSPRRFRKEARGLSARLRPGPPGRAPALPTGPGPLLTRGSCCLPHTGGSHQPPGPRGCPRRPAAGSRWEPGPLPAGPPEQTAQLAGDSQRDRWIDGTKPLSRGETEVVTAPPGERIGPLQTARPYLPLRAPSGRH